jgi:hypothetical protein
MRLADERYVEEALPEALPDAVVRGPVVEATRDAILLRVPTVGRFLVRDGEPVRLDRHPRAADADIRCFLDGAVAAAQALMRGVPALRAATVVLNGRAVALVGVPAVGKSTVAAALARRGHPVLADSVTVVEQDGQIHPLAARPQLWPDMVARLELDPAAGEPVRPGLSKLAFDLGQGEAAPLGAVVQLANTVVHDEPTHSIVTGSDKTFALLRFAWCTRLLGPLGLEGRWFTLVSRAAAAVDVWHVLKPSALSPGDVAALLEEAVR